MSDDLRRGFRGINPTFPYRWHWMEFFLGCFIGGIIGGAIDVTRWLLR